MDRHEARALLGVPASADPATVRRAYRRLARTLHPDAGGDPERFLAVTRAMEVLGDDGGPAPQTRVAAVDDRWWDAPGAWHEGPVARDATRLDLDVPDRPAVPADRDLLATLLARAEGDVLLRSRAPGSRLHGMIAWLQPDLLAALRVGPASDGPRAGHDVEASIRASAGRGRRHLAEVTPPAGWTRARGSESVSVSRRFRPCRAAEDTAVRLAGEVDGALDAMGWPLADWYLLRA